MACFKACRLIYRTALFALLLMPVSVFAADGDAIAGGTGAATLSGFQLGNTGLPTNNSTASQSSSSDPTTPCDPQFMQALEARAWLEAQREVSQNENLIVKPDSVLEYSCFNQILNKAASNWSGQDGINRQFSETDAWKTTGFTTTTTDTSLTNVVGTALSSYMTSNFPEKYLGGRLASPTKITGDTMATVNGDTPYTCTLMSQIWEQARCQNFDQLTTDNKPGNATSNYNQDGFRDFFYYANEDNDPRVLPDTATFHSCPALDQGHKLADIYNKSLDEAFNKNQTMFVLKNPDDDTDPDSTQYKVDDVKTYFDLILPGTCSSNAIPTGVKVYRGSSSPVDDKICPNPGCSYDGNTCTSSGSSSGTSGTTGLGHQ